MNVAEAKAKLSELIDRALRGEEVWIARNGKPIICLRSAAADQMGREATPYPGRTALFGALAHLGPVPDEAWAPEPEDASDIGPHAAAVRAVAEPPAAFDHDR